MAHHTVVILLLGVLLTGSMLGMSIRNDSRDADEELIDYEHRLLARDMATTGLSMTVRKLADSPAMGSWTSGNYFNAAPYQSGTFTSDVTVRDPATGGTSGDTVDVVVRGVHGPGRHVVFARYARDKDDKGIPPAFRSAIVSDFYMQINGNMLIAAISKRLNASIHTNDDLTVKGNTFLVEGFGTYTGTVNLNNQASNNFIPNVDYNGPDPNYHWADSIKIPSIDAARLKDTAQNKSGTYIEMGGPTGSPYQINNAVIDFTDPSSAFWTTNGLTYTCTSGTCGTEQNPFVLFINGPADFLNTVQVVGNGVIIATGDMTIASQGSGGGIYGSLNGNQETTTLLATLGNMDVGVAGGNACLGRGPASYLGNDGNTYSNNHCQSLNGGFEDGITLYSEKRVEFKGTPFIVGGVVAKEAHFNGGGNPWITYASANEGTLDAGFEYIVPIGPILIAYSEF